MSVYVYKSSVLVDSVFESAFGMLTMTIRVENFREILLTPLFTASHIIQVNTHAEINL